MTADAEYDAIVLAGGAAKRLGGVDKPGVSVGGRALLDRVLTASRGADRTIVVGGRRATARQVLWARESPPGGGPLAALDAGLRMAEAGTVLVLSADLPFLDAATVRRLLDTLRAGGRKARCSSTLTDATSRSSPPTAPSRSAASWP